MCKQRQTPEKNHPLPGAHMFIGRSCALEGLSGSSSRSFRLSLLPLNFHLDALVSALSLLSEFSSRVLLGPACFVATGMASVTVLTRRRRRRRRSCLRLISGVLVCARAVAPARTAPQIAVRSPIF